jgi:signal transduction histidine kinase
MDWTSTTDGGALKRPWYSYLLVFIGSLALLGAAFGPAVGVVGTPPGGTVSGPQRRLKVQEGGPLARAGIKTGDRWLSSETIVPAGKDGDPVRTLRWKGGIPRSGTVQVEQAGQSRWVQVAPAPPTPIVGLGWAVVGLMNVALTALAVALFWQRPRDGAAVLLGLVLLAAPVFAFPREPRLVPIALAAHFLAVFPPLAGAPPRRWWRWVLFYLPLVFFGFIGTAMWGEGQTTQAGTLFHLIALGYAAYGVLQVFLRGRKAAPEQRPVFHTLAVAAGAMVAAVLVSASERWWVISGQVVPLHFLPAALFSAAVGHLVFRLRALEVRVTARRTLQYLLARWTLGTLFLIPGFLLVWRFGQLSVSHEPSRPGDVVPYFLWMFTVALLLGKRQQVLRNLDRRFFRDAEATRQSLIRLAHGLGGQSHPAEVLAALESGVRAALRPRWQRFSLLETPPDASAALAVPLRRGAHVLGNLELGPKESGEPYSQEEEQLLEAAAVQAAMALENARLSAALLERQRAELNARSAGVLAGSEEERRRLAADLHDGVLPELRAVAAEVERLKGRANGLSPELERLESDLRGTMDGVREVMEALRPSALDMLGLVDALESCLRRAAARCDPPLAVSVRRSGPEPAVTPEQSLALFRICQEAMNNIVKHSGARRAGLELTNEGGVLTLAVWDDGCGLASPTTGDGGRGLNNIRYRADAIGAAVTWSRPEEGGTRVEVRLSRDPLCAP